MHIRGWICLGLSSVRRTTQPEYRRSPQRAHASSHASRCGRLRPRHAAARTHVCLPPLPSAACCAAARGTPPQLLHAAAAVKLRRRRAPSADAADVYPLALFAAVAQTRLLSSSTTRSPWLRQSRNAAACGFAPGLRAAVAQVQAPGGHLRAAPSSVFQGGGGATCFARAHSTAQQSPDVASHRGGAFFVSDATRALGRPCIVCASSLLLRPIAWACDYRSTGAGAPWSAAASAESAYAPRRRRRSCATGCARLSLLPLQPESAAVACTSASRPRLCEASRRPCRCLAASGIVTLARI